MRRNDRKRRNGETGLKKERKQKKEEGRKQNKRMQYRKNLNKARRNR